MATNGLTIELGTADLEVYAAGDTYGFKLMNGTTITEGRGSQFAASSGEDAPTYKDEQPFSRMVYETFNGGFGQDQENRYFGGLTGQGGDSAHYLWTNGWTLKGTKLLPGMAQNMISPASPTSGVSNELEIPRGVMPTTHPAGAYTQFTLAGGITFQKIRLLLKFDGPQANPITIQATVNATTFTSAALTSLENYTFFKWVTLTAAAQLTLAAGTHTLTVPYNANGVIIGAFIGTVGATANVIQPYFQILKTSPSGDSYRWWSKAAQRIETIFYNNSYWPIVITSNSFYNASNPTIAERALTYPFVYSLKFDTQLYIGQSDGVNGRTDRWDANGAANCLASSSNTTTVCLGPATKHGGKIFMVDGLTKRKIQTWDGNTANAATTIIDTDKIGTPSVQGRNNINNIIIFKGLLYALKPEGIYCVYDDPLRITTLALPRIIPVIDFNELEHLDNGRYVVQHQDMLIFNVRNQVYQVNVTQGGNQISVLVPPIPIGKFFSSNYVSGISSDGQALYISYNNIGTFALYQGGWHVVSEFYEYNTAESVPSALHYTTNPTGAPDYIYVGDGRTLNQIPIPAYWTSYSTQLFQKDQNKAFYWVSSVNDYNLANILKYLRAVSIRGGPSGWSYKAILAIWQSGDPHYRTILEKGLNQGLHRDLSIGPHTPNAGVTPTVTTKLLDGSGNPTSTTAPLTWVTTDFQNATYSSEKNVSTSDVDNPVKITAASLIVYGWNPTGKQYDGSLDTADITYIESMNIKFMPILDFLGYYQVTIDVSALDRASLTRAQVYTSVNWLRNRELFHSPTQFSFKDLSGAVKTVLGFIQNWHVDLEPSGAARTDIPIPRRISFNILSIQGEQPDPAIQAES